MQSGVLKEKAKETITQICRKRVKICFTVHLPNVSFLLLR